VVRFRNLYRDKTGDELTWKTLYDANPHGTIAVCRFRKDGPVFNPRDPHDASIWDDCDPSQQNIALIAGAYLRIPMEDGAEPPAGDEDEDMTEPSPAAPAPSASPAPAPTAAPAVESAPTQLPAPAAAPTPASADAPEAVPAPTDTDTPAATTASVPAPAATPATPSAPAPSSESMPSEKDDTEPAAWLSDDQKSKLFIILPVVGILLVIAFVVDRLTRRRGRHGNQNASFISTEAAEKAATLPTPDARKGQASRQETHRRIPPPTG
jgi:hypothetical protein